MNSMTAKRELNFNIIILQSLSFQQTPPKMSPPLAFYGAPRGCYGAAVVPWSKRSTCHGRDVFGVVASDS